MLAVADAFDAMTSLRPYRRSLSATEAAAEIGRCAGTQFDPEVVDAFLGALDDGRDPPRRSCRRRLSRGWRYSDAQTSSFVRVRRITSSVNAVVP